jgi:hypothetical protein
MKIIEAASRTFHVSAVQVTEENMEAVAAWCGGFVTNELFIESGSRRFIELYQGNGVSKRAIFAYVSWWITKSGDHFSTYRNSSFRGKFDHRAQGEAEKKREKIIDIIEMLTCTSCCKTNTGDVADMIMGITGRNS